MKCQEDSYRGSPVAAQEAPKTLVAQIVGVAELIGIEYRQLAGQGFSWWVLQRAKDGVNIQYSAEE